MPIIEDDDRFAGVARRVLAEATRQVVVVEDDRLRRQMQRLARSHVAVVAHDRRETGRRLSVQALASCWNMRVSLLGT